jgi:hypothetical protein
MFFQRSLMARCVVAFTTLAFAASAAPKDDKKKKEDKTGSSMDEGGKDPSASETFEAGQFVPGKKKTIDTKICAEGDEECEEESANAAEEGKEKEAEPKKTYKAKKTIGVFAEGLIGFGKAPQPGPATPAASGVPSNTTGDSTSFGFLVGGHFDVSSPFRLMLRVPITTGTIKTYGNQKANETALGAPELAGRLRLGDPGETEWAIKLGIGIPVAQGNPDVTDISDARGYTQARLQRVANAANGWHDPELYAMKRLPVTPSLQFLYRATKIRVNGELKAVFLPKIGGGVSKADFSPNGTYEANGLGMWTILGGSFSYEIITRKLFGALAAWATYEIAHDYTWEGGNPPSPFQFVIEPRVLAQFGKVVPSVGFVVPLGGQLGGNIYGLRLHVDVVF